MAESEKPKAPKSAYLFWFHENKEKIVSEVENPNNFGEMIKKGAQLWKQVLDKSEFEDRAALDQMRYETEMEKWRAKSVKTTQQNKKPAKKPNKTPTKKETKRKTIDTDVLMDLVTKNNLKNIPNIPRLIGKCWDKITVQYNEHCNTQFSKSQINSKYKRYKGSLTTEKSQRNRSIKRTGKP